MVPFKNVCWARPCSPCTHDYWDISYQNSAWFIILNGEDSQLVDSFSPLLGNETASLNKSESCLNNVKSLMTSNKLKFNDDETEAMIIAPPSRQQKSQLTHLTIGKSLIPFSPFVKNLGGVIDFSLTTETQVNFLCETCLFQLRNIGSVRHLLTTEVEGVVASTGTTYM